MFNTKSNRDMIRAMERKYLPSFRDKPLFYIESCGIHVTNREKALKEVHEAGYTWPGIDTTGGSIDIELDGKNLFHTIFCDYPSKTITYCKEKSCVSTCTMYKICRRLKYITI